jgi:hypothetical protein
MRHLFLALFSAGIGLSAHAATISFDEIQPANNNSDVLTDEYSEMGVQFVGTDDGTIWSGMSDGDPGGWAIEGTNGSAFVGLNGRSYELTVLLDQAVEAFRIDVTRASGSTADAALMVVGFRDGTAVEEILFDLGSYGINEWSTIELSEDVDEVNWVVSGGRQPYGLDNLQWGREGSEAMVALIEVRPGRRGTLNPFSNGVVPVVIFGTETFDVGNVDPISLAFGPAGAPAFGEVKLNMGDINGDGYADLISHHRIPVSGIALGDTEACMTGETYDREPFEGCSMVTTVPRQR